MVALSKIKYDWEGEYDVSSLADDNIDKLSTSLIPNNSRVLELGCSTGYLTRHLVKNKKCQVVGVELNPAAARKAKKYTTQIIIGDLENPQTWTKIQKAGKFDVVFGSAVIEHLTDPWRVLKKIYALLPINGLLVLTMPNIAWWRCRLSLLLGKWDYQDYGTFDKTHNKFFTLFSMRHALQDVGFKILVEKYDPAGGAKFLTPVLKLFPNAYAHQIAILAKKG